MLGKFYIEFGEILFSNWIRYPKNVFPFSLLFKNIFCPSTKLIFYKVRFQIIPRSPDGIFQLWFRIKLSPIFVDQSWQLIPSIFNWIEVRRTIWPTQIVYFSLMTKVLVGLEVWIGALSCWNTYLALHIISAKGKRLFSNIFISYWFLLSL